MKLETHIKYLTDLAGWTQEQKNELERLGRLLRDSKLIECLGEDTKHISDDRCLIRYLMQPSKMCLAGDTLIPTMPCPGATRKSYTIKEIADAFTERGRHNAWVKLLKIRTVDRDGTIRPTRIQHAAMTGRKSAYRITTAGPLPRTLVATGNHPILTPRGYRRVDRLAPGDKVVANGVAVLSNTQLQSLWDERYQLGDIAQLLKVSRTTAFRRLRAAGVNTAHRKGFPYKLDHELLDPRARARRLRKPFCEVCGEPASNVHHLDKNLHNNSPGNLASLCLLCHMAFHNDPFQLRVYETTIASIEPVGIIDVYGLETADGNHNFVANGLVVHNCEFQGRTHGVRHFTQRGDLHSPRNIPTKPPLKETIVLKKLGVLVLTIVACVAMATTFIRSDTTAGAMNQPRDQTVTCSPAESPNSKTVYLHARPEAKRPRPPIILRPSIQTLGPFRLPVFVVPDRPEQHDLTTRRPGGTTSD